MKCLAKIHSSKAIWSYKPGCHKIFKKTKGEKDYGRKNKGKK